MIMEKFKKFIGRFKLNSKSKAYEIGTLKRAKFQELNRYALNRDREALDKFEDSLDLTLDEFQLGQNIDTILTDISNGRYSQLQKASLNYMELRIKEKEALISTAYQCEEAKDITEGLRNIYSSLGERKMFSPAARTTSPNKLERYAALIA